MYNSLFTSTLLCRCPMSPWPPPPLSLIELQDRQLLVRCTCSRLITNARHFARHSRTRTRDILHGTPENWATGCVRDAIKIDARYFARHSRTRTRHILHAIPENLVTGCNAIKIDARYFTRHSRIRTRNFLYDAPDRMNATNRSSLTLINIQKLMCLIYFVTLQSNVNESISPFADDCISSQG